MISRLCSKLARRSEEWRSSFDEERKRIQAQRVEEEIPQIFQTSILWQYYAKGVKNFKDLKTT